MDTGNYWELTIPADEPTQQLLIAVLSEAGFDGFEESDLALKAYIPEAGFSATAMDKISNQYQFIYSKSIIYKQNWNRVWESNFDPVQVDDFVGIRAGFHPSFTTVTHELIITPKMSFGTGHHATTYTVMQLMREMEFTGKSVFDFGTGTGILAILAAKLGASRVLAVDNDDWCIENASENISVNQCNIIDIQKIDVVTTGENFDIILANINKHIILANLSRLAGNLAKDGQLVLSGLLTTDADEIMAACTSLGLQHKKTQVRNGWIASRFHRIS